MSVFSKLSNMVRSLTSHDANVDVPKGTDVPDPQEGAVARPDRDPMVGHEPERRED